MCNACRQCTLLTKYVFASILCLLMLNMYMNIAAHKIDLNKNSTDLNKRNEEPKATAREETTVSTTTASDKKKWSCVWSPTDQKECNDVFCRRLPPPTAYHTDHHNGKNVLVDSQRWICFGDSTMWRLFSMSRLNLMLVNKKTPLKGYGDGSKNGCLSSPPPVMCRKLVGNRCKLNDLFSLPFAKTWIAPNRSMGMIAGPVVYGAENPFCNDCSGCNTQILECLAGSTTGANTNNGTSTLSVNRVNESEFAHKSMHETATNNNKPHIRSLFSQTKCAARYGGFISMEFAKDVELQTPEFQTTQENIAAYIDRVWNTAELLKDWGKSVCVLSAGNHDMVIANITTTVEYIQNVKFMLTNIMDSCCVHMIWLRNTTDIKDYPEHIQTKEKMKLWDVSVKKMIEVEPTLHRMMSFIDVHNASLTHAREDHIHMDQNWYKLLGFWFGSFVE